MVILRYIQFPKQITKSEMSSNSSDSTNKYSSEEDSSQGESSKTSSHNSTKHLNKQDSSENNSTSSDNENEPRSSSKNNQINNNTDNAILKKDGSSEDSDYEKSQYSSDENESKSSRESTNKETNENHERFNGSPNHPNSDTSLEESKIQSKQKESSDDSKQDSNQTSEEDDEAPTESSPSNREEKITNSIKNSQSDREETNSTCHSEEVETKSTKESYYSSESSDEDVKNSSRTQSKSIKKSSDSKNNKSSKKSANSDDSDNETESGAGSKQKNEDSDNLSADTQSAPFDFTVVSPNTQLNPKTDRFGWAIEDDEQVPTKRNKKLEKEENQKEKERESKWIYMMKKENWKKFFDKKGKYRKVLERRVKKGIPDCLRSRAWRLILDPHAVDNPNRPTIDSYYDKGVPQCDYVIRVDIPRTMPRVPMFTRKDVRISLYRVLRAYSNADPELGYYQGMAFSAALLMSYMDETNAFWSFVGLMKGKNHKLRDFYDNSFTKLKEVNKVWDYLLLKKFKDVHDNLKKNNIEHLLYTTSWFLCAFMNINFETALKLRIFDRFTLFGTRALISFGATIVDMNKVELAKGTFDVVIPILQNPHSTPAMKNWRQIIKVYDKNFLTQKEYKHYFKKAGVKYF